MEQLRMSSRLSAKAFDEACQSEVTNFNCGENPWALTINEWIKSDDAIQRVQKKSTKVWLYYNDADKLVGYGSLGVTKWPIFSEEPKKPVLILPNLGVQKEFQRQG